MTGSDPGETLAAEALTLDILGEVAVLVNGRRVAGYYHDTFDGSGLASGVYIYRLTAGTFAASRWMVLLK